MAELENEHRKSCPNHLRTLLRFHWTLRCLQRRYKIIIETLSIAYTTYTTNGKLEIQVEKFSK